MELIYLYIRKYENLFNDVGFNFSSNYVADFRDGQLTVRDNEDAIKGYYGQNINNVVMFLGKNGVGKSTLLDLLGMTRDDRCDDNYVGKGRNRTIRATYFMLYHLYEDYFGFEFVDDSFLSGEDRIHNIDMRYDSEKSALYKIPMGDVFRLDNGVFVYCGNILNQWLKNRKYHNRLKFAYITSDRYNNRITNRYRSTFEEYMFERKYYLEENYYEHLYKYLIHLRGINNELLQEKNITIQNAIKTEFYSFDRTDDVQEYLKDRKKELDKLFHLKSEMQIQIEREILGKEPKKETGTMKTRFLHTFYAEAIEYYFLEQLVGWSKSDGININVDIPIPNFKDIKTEISMLADEEMEIVEKGFMEIMPFQDEYACLLYKIQNNTDEKGNIDLKSILIYVLNRVEKAAKPTVDIFERRAMDNILTWLERLPEHYFRTKRDIIIDCNVNEEDELLIQLFKFYDVCFKVRNDEGGSNSIFKILNVEMPKMSEGQRVFLDIVSKCVSAIYAVEPEDSIVLLIDEPDRALHPELARNFLDTLLDTISKCEDRNIQVVITSHSPFIVTDILPENVYAIDVQGDSRVIRTDKETYATNIYYLLMDSFMLNSTFGEHSNKRLQHIAKILSGSERIDDEKLKEIKRIIDRIGERTIRNKLLQLYKKHEGLKTELVDLLLRENDDEKLKKIKEILDNND